MLVIKIRLLIVGGQAVLSCMLGSGIQNSCISKKTAYRKAVICNFSVIGYLVKEVLEVEFFHNMLEKEISDI